MRIRITHNTHSFPKYNTYAASQESIAPYQTPASPNVVVPSTQRSGAINRRNGMALGYDVRVIVLLNLVFLVAYKGEHLHPTSRRICSWAPWGGSLLLGDQIGRASCRERVSSPV